MKNLADYCSKQYYMDFLTSNENQGLHCRFEGGANQLYDEPTNVTVSMFSYGNNQPPGRIVTTEVKGVRDFGELCEAIQKLNQIKFKYVRLVRKGQDRAVKRYYFEKKNAA